MPDKGVILHPGIAKGRERANLEGVLYENPEKLIYFKFNSSWLDNPQVIATLPANSFVYGEISCRVTEAFLGSGPILRIGTQNVGTDIGSAGISVTGSRIFNVGEKYGHLFEEKTILTAITRATTGVQGNGWVVLKYLELNLVSGFRQTRELT